MFDAHCHLQFEAFDEDREEVLERAREAGVRGLMIADYDGERRGLAAELSQRAGIYATAGLHPWAVAELDQKGLSEALKELEAVLEEPCWSGLGELGLDYYRVKDDQSREVQRKAFVAQLGMARERNLPVVIHAVRAHNSLIGLLREEGLPEAGGILHGYSGSARQVGTFLMMNLDISIGTAVTFENRKRLEEVVRQVPEDRLLVETDAPDRPPGERSGERNEIAYLPEVMEAVAGLRSCSVERIAAMTERNLRARFRLGDEQLE